MKKNKFTCEICKHDVNTGDRDTGTQPTVIGCTQSNCKGIAKSHFYMVDQSIEPESIFIRPKNNFEWKAIECELERNIQLSHPDKKDRKVQKMHRDLMLRIRDHVKNGGMVILPKDVVEDLPKGMAIVK